MSLAHSLVRGLFYSGLGGVAFAQISPEFVRVGLAGNPADPLTGYGIVDYSYLIGTYEVTNAEYVAFLNAVGASDAHDLYDPRMDGGPFGVGGIVRSGVDGSFSYASRPGYENQPVCYVSFWDASRFANWLSNGQPTGPQGPGTTESGGYELGGVTHPAASSVRRTDDWLTNADLYLLPTLNEWYKAAYYHPFDEGGPEDSYWSKPTMSDDYPLDEPPPGGENSANIYYAVGESFTDVGAYADSPSFFGTFDQAGNIWEWHDRNPSDPPAWFESRGQRGGFFGSYSDVRSESWAGGAPDLADYYVGFRLMKVDPDNILPEVNGSILLNLLFVWMLCRRRRIRRVQVFAGFS